MVIKKLRFTNELHIMLRHSTIWCHPKREHYITMQIYSKTFLSRTFLHPLISLTTDWADRGSSFFYNVIIVQLGKQFVNAAYQHATYTLQSPQRHTCVAGPRLVLCTKYSSLKQVHFYQKSNINSWIRYHYSPLPITNNTHFSRIPYKRQLALTSMKAQSCLQCPEDYWVKK